MRAPNLRTVYATVSITLGTLMLGLLFWHSANTDPMWAVAAFVLVYNPDPRIAFRDGMMRLVLTLVGCTVAVFAIYLFGIHRWLLPAALGVTMFVCGHVFSFRVGWRALLVCVALVIGSSLVQPDADVRIALTRGIEVAAGSTLAILLSLPLSYLERKRGDKIVP